MINQLRSWLVEYNQEEIINYARKKKRVLSYLTALTYDPEPLLSWRAVSALGVAAGCIADQDAEYVRVHLRRLMWLLNDESGGIGWRAPESMGEIIRARPQLFGTFIPIVIAVLDMEPEDAPPFRPGTLWALGRLAQVAFDEIYPALPWIIPCLKDPHAQTRGMAVWCLMQLHQGRTVVELQSLVQDEKPVLVFQNGEILNTTVSQLASQAIQAEAA